MAHTDNDTPEQNASQESFETLLPERIILTFDTGCEVDFQACNLTNSSSELMVRSFS
jgi:methionine-rich copper-binding protein CopC